MKRLLIIALLGFVAWKGYGEYQLRRTETVMQGEEITMTSPATRLSAVQSAQYQCDGRTYCSQMKSCAEATFFLRNCPGVKMDGNNDGVPCEKQWCR